MEFNAYLRGLNEAATAASTTLATIQFRTHPPPSWDVCLQRLRVLSAQLARLHEMLYGGGSANADAFSSGALAMGQNELARQISLAKQATVIPTVSGVDPTLNLRTKAIFEITAAHTQAATVAAPSEYPALFGAAPAGASSSAAAAAASAPAAAAAAAPPSSSAAPPSSGPALPRLDDPVACEQLSHALENALDTYNAQCVTALARCQALAKQWSASSVSTFVSSVMASSAAAGPGGAAAAGAAGASAASLANTNSVAAAQTAAKRKQRERDTRVDLADLLRVELQGRRLK